MNETKTTSPPVLLDWQVAPGPAEQWSAWIDCRDKWLASKSRRSGSEHTRRAYRTAWEQFMAWSEARGIPPWQVTVRTAAAWVDHLAEGQGRAASTVGARVAALSSFYSYAGEVYAIMDEGREVPLHQGINPFRAVERPEVQAYGKAIYPSQAEVMRLVAAIDLSTARGWRDRAIVLGLLTMAQRFNGWLAVRWGDIHQGETTVYMVYQAKGGRRCKAAIHSEVWAAVLEWLDRSGRAPLEPEDFVFVADEPERAARLPGVPMPGNQPLSNATVNGLLRALARRAGVDPVRAHAHGLRHAGARWMRQQGADIWELQRALGHSSVATTQIYLEEVVEEPENRYGAEIARQLRLM
jgi:site-specific recombinase XerD